MTWPTFESQDDIPEQFRDSYEERDGKWVPRDRPGEEALSALEAERKARKEAEDARKAAEKAQRDVQDQLLEAKRKAEAKEAGLGADDLKELREKIRADERRAVSEEMEALKAKVEEAQQVQEENRTLKLDQKVKSQMRDSGVRPNRIDRMFALYRDDFDLDDEGKPIVKEHPGKALKIFIEDDVKKEIPEWFTGTKADGGGAGGITNGVTPGGMTADDVRANPQQARAAARSGS